MKLLKVSFCRFSSLTQVLRVWQFLTTPVASYASTVHQVICDAKLIMLSLVQKEIGSKSDQDFTKLGSYFSSIESDSCIKPDATTKVKKCPGACGYDYSFLP